MDESEEQTQPLVPIITDTLPPSTTPPPSNSSTPILPITTPPIATTPTATRKLKRFRSDSAPTPIPATPPLNSLPIPVTPPPSTPPFTPEASSFDSLPSTPLNENDVKPEDTPGAPARRILKIAKASKLSTSEELQMKATPSITVTPPPPPVPTIVEAGSMRSDGTMRKTIKIRAAQVPKVINQSPEKAKSKAKATPGVTKGRGKVAAGGRIRPNTNFLTRLVNSTERHNANLVNEEQELEYETIESGDSSEEFDDVNGELMDEEEAEGDTDDSEGIADETKENINNFMETTAHELKKERRLLMKQITKMRQREGITLIKGLAKLYGIHVNILEDTEVKLKPTKEPPPATVVRSIGKIGYGFD